jgi:hypothetical protein
MSSDTTFEKLLRTNDFQLHRKPLFEKLEKNLGAKVISYIANPMHPFSGIMSQDIIFFEDLLRSTNGATKGYLIINSPGGDGNVAEKMITMCRQRFTKSFKVIVPNFAKSAATMIALGSDKILMGYLAELGPIDPQLGNLMNGFTPARSFIDGLSMIRSFIAKGDPIQMYLPMLAQIKPEVVAQCQSAIDGSKEFAEKWLKECMLKNDPKQAKDVAEWLSEGKVYKSHGKVIDYSEAHDILKLNVEKIPENSDLWNTIWELYCREIMVFQGPIQSLNAVKLFESATISLTMQLQISTIERQQPQNPPQMPPQTPRPINPRSDLGDLPMPPFMPKPGSSSFPKNPLIPLIPKPISQPEETKDKPVIQEPKTPQVEPPKPDKQKEEAKKPED